MVDVKVKVFGPLRDIIPGDEVLLNVPPPHNGTAAFEALASLHPKLQDWRPSIRLAVNLEYADMNQELHSGDEISFIPPVSGG